MFDSSTPPPPVAMVSSRLCVKNLPKHTGDRDLRKLFADKWNLTDVKLVRSRDGTSRQFGFVGFETAEDAGVAQKFFDKTFLGASRLSIEFARQVNGEKGTRPWSKHTKGTSAHDKAHGDVKRTDPKIQAKKKAVGHSNHHETIQADEDKEKLQEFLELMLPRRKGKFWGNDDMGGEADTFDTHKKVAVSSDEGPDSESEQVQSSVSSGEDKGKDDGNLEKSDMDYLRSRMSATFNEKDLSESCSVISSSELEEILSDEGMVSEDQMGDMELGSRSDSEPLDNQGLSRNSNLDVGPTGHGDKKGAEVVEDSKKLFVRNLSYTATEAELLGLFQDFGDIVDVRLATDKRTGRSKGFALVTFTEEAAARNALERMDGHIFRGRLMHVLPGHARPHTQEHPDYNADEVKSSFKAGKEAQRRETAGNRAAWNTLFMRPDTVVEAVAEHYGVQKNELLDRDASDLGVRMALGETQVIAKTKAALGEAGVNVEVLEEAAFASGKSSKVVAVSRSSSVLLIKNLPYKAEAVELSDMFGRFGRLSRIVLPPTKVLAFVEYIEASAAATAFKSLAYKNYHGVPLYLEWAPTGVFSTPAVPSPMPASLVTHEDGKQEEHKGGKLEGLDNENSEDEGSGPVSTLFVKNLSFSTTESGMKKHFDSVVSEVGATLRSAILSTRLRSDGKRVSAGYGFIEVDSDAGVKHVLKKLQGSLLDGHKIELQRSMPRSKKGEVVAVAANSRKRNLPKDKTTKLLVRNLAFEATKKDLIGLFGPFGHIKTCRIPKKFDGTHRGFAFVDFITKLEAESAKDGVSGAHLYGRRLVIEYAKDDSGGLEGLRARTGQKFNEAEGFNSEGRKRLKA